MESTIDIQGVAAPLLIILRLVDLAEVESQLPVVTENVVSPTWKLAIAICMLANLARARVTFLQASAKALVTRLRGSSGVGA